MSSSSQEKTTVRDGLRKQPLEETIARIIDPGAWRVMDGYLAEVKRKYAGQNAGYDPESFKHKQSMAKAREIIAVSAGQWRPIASAPTDGTDVLLGAPAQTYRGKPTASRCTIGHWTTEEECRVYLGDCGGECRCPEYEDGTPSWISWDGGFTVENPPTHWMPLPPPPDTSDDKTGPGMNKGSDQ